MQRFLLLSLLTALTSTLTHADDQSSIQINFMKTTYTHLLNNQLSGIDVLKKFSTTDLNQWIKKTDAIADAHLGEMCDWVYDPMLPGQDHDIRLSQLKYTILHNGRVRVQGINFGEKFQIDYELKCDHQRCKINDLWDPQSYKQKLKHIAKQGAC